MNPLSEFNDNSVTVKSIIDQDQDFKKLFNIKNSIKYIDCKNMNINFDSGINKLTLKGCSNIILHVNKIISGIDIIKSNQISITTDKKEPIYFLNIDNSNNIIFNIKKKLFNKIYVEIQDSTDIKFIDFNQNLIKKY
jgi:hypothetical protein